MFWSHDQCQPTELFGAKLKQQWLQSALTEQTCWTGLKIIYFRLLCYGSHLFIEQLNAPVTLIPGRFALNLFPPLDVSPPGHFVLGCSGPGLFAHTGHLALRTFRLQISMVCVGVWCFDVESYVHYILRLAASNKSDL